MRCPQCNESAAEGAATCGRCGAYLGHKTEEIANMAAAAAAVERLQAGAAAGGRPPPAGGRASLSDAATGDPPCGVAEDLAVLALRPGDIVAESYEVKGFIGAGGMGAVFRVFDRLREMTVALKILRPSLASNRAACLRFEREAEVARLLLHPNVVRVLEAGVDRARGLRFFTMEVLEGISLRSWMEDKARFGMETAAAEACAIVGQVLDALVTVHLTATHRDVKPENIIMIGGGKAKLVDFGLARGPRDAAAADPGGFSGSTLYMAPEQRGRPDLADARADVYSAFLVLHELLTQRIPVGRPRGPRLRRPDVPRELDELVVRCLDGDPDRRPPTARAALDELAACARGLERAKAAAEPATWKGIFSWLRRPAN